MTYLYVLQVNSQINVVPKILYLKMKVLISLPWYKYNYIPAQSLCGFHNKIRWDNNSLTFIHPIC